MQEWLIACFQVLVVIPISDRETNAGAHGFAPCWANHVSRGDEIRSRWPYKVSKVVLGCAAGSGEGALMLDIIVVRGRPMCMDVRVVDFDALPSEWIKISGSSASGNAQGTGRQVLTCDGMGNETK